MYFSFGFGREKRSIENPAMPISVDGIAEFLGLTGAKSAAGVSVTTEKALGVPAVWAAVNFLAGTLAGLPMQVFKKTAAGREKVKNGLYDILHDAVNPGCSSFQWRKHLFESVFTHGRALSWIERDQAGFVANIWPLDPTKVTIKRVSGQLVYSLRSGRQTKTYQADEIIDIPFMLKSDMLAARSPISQCKDAIGLAIAASNYAAKAFSKAGVPALSLQSNFKTPEGVKRAAEDVAKAIEKVNKSGGNVLTMPPGTELKPLAFNPQDMQLVEAQRFCIEQIARVYSLPPVFVQDLTHGTFSNTEQQDLQFVKHTLKRWIEQFEQELNLKIFGRQSSFAPQKFYIEMNVDGLLRGDFKTRMDGLALAIMSGLLTPNEARALENRPPHADGDNLMIQGGTVPIAMQLLTPQAPPAGKTGGKNG